MSRVLQLCRAKVVVLLLVLSSLPAYASFTRWHGWGMRLWDFEEDRISGTETRWTTLRHWGFTAPELSYGSPASGQPKVLREGVRVTSIERMGPAEQAGLRTGDLILSVDGQAVSNPADLQVRMERSYPGQRIRLEYVRGEEKAPRVATVVVEARYIPASPAPKLLPRNNTPEPRLNRQASGGSVQIPGPTQFRLSPRGSAEADVHARADRIVVEEFPARAGYGRSVVYRLSGNVLIEFRTGVRIMSSHPVVIRWTDGSPITEVQFTEPDQ